jgi:hypothetical protein
MIKNYRREEEKCTEMCNEVCYFITFFSQKNISKLRLSTLYYHARIVLSTF